MQWYQHTRAAQMQLVIDECIRQEPLARYEDEDDEETRKERYRCPECGEESFWVIHDLRRPVAGCTENDCPVEARMGLLETLEFLWDEAEWEELPGDGTERKRTLGRKLGDLSAYALEAEELHRQEAAEQARLRYERMVEDRDEWRAEAERERNEAVAWKGRAGESEDAMEALRAKLERRVDERALRRGLGWGMAALAASVLWLEAFLDRAGAEMLFAWNTPHALFYLVALGGACAYLMFAVVYRDARRAAERDELPSPLHERLGWWVGLGWSGKVAACAVVPYIVVGVVGASEVLSVWLPRAGVEWLLICTVAGVSCALALCAWMAEDLSR